MAHPGRRLECSKEGDTRGRWDADRIAQVVSNLVGNAVAHGADTPVTVSVRGNAQRVSLIVANGGEIHPEIRETICSDGRTTFTMVLPCAGS